MEAAPDSAITAATAAFMAASSIWAGMKVRMTAISSRSPAAISGRPPASKAVADSSRCLIILASNVRMSSSLTRSLLVSVRAAMSRSFSAARISRTVARRLASLDFIASFMASVSWARRDMGTSRFEPEPNGNRWINPNH